MKKLLLLVFALLGIAGMSMAQDVYYTGFHPHPTISYLNGAAVYKNGEMIWLIEDDTHNFAPVSFVIDKNTDDWYLAYTADDGDNYVTKNGEETLLHVTGDGTHINKIFWYDDPSGDPEDCLYAVGQVNITSDLKFHAAVWHGTDPTPLIVWDDTNIESSANDLFVYDGDVYYAGYFDHHATIFKNDEILLTLSDEFSEVTEMVLTDDDYLISVGRVEDPSTNNYVLTVWSDSGVYYTLTDPDSYGGPEALAVSAGDVFVYGTEGSARKIWQNGEVIYENDSDGYLMWELAATSHLYYCYDGDVYKDFDLLYESEGDFGSVVVDLVVEESCDDPDVRTLPYYEGFTFMDTDWECWTKEDEGLNGSRHSYWYRNGSNPDYDYWYADNDCAVILYNTEEYQIDKLISPAIALPSDPQIRLSFWSYVGYLSYYEYSGVEIATMDNPTSYTTVWEVDPGDTPDGEWVLYDVDLSDYAGQTVYVAFVYEGQDAHNWAIDEVSITSSTTGISESSKGNMTVAPNPANDIIYIKGVEADTEVQIYNSLGMKVKSLYVSGDAKISIGDLAAGIYLVRCGEQTVRLVKE